MYRLLGCIKETKVGENGVFRAAPIVKVGQVLELREDFADALRWADPYSFVDITPRRVFEKYGLEVPHRHALFYTAPCSACPPPGGPVRITSCPQCNNTRRVVFA